MRFRTRGVTTESATIVVPNYCWVYGGSPLCPVPGYNLVYDSSAQHASILDETIPNFYKRMKAGEVFFNTMYSESYEMTQTPTYVWYQFDKTGQRITNTVRASCGDASVYRLLTSDSSGSAVDTLLAPYSGERDVAVTAAWANVDVSESMLLASLGELPETIQFVASNMNRLIKVLALFKQKKLKLYLKRSFMKPSQWNDAIANFWLEMRYAVRPIAFEVEQYATTFSADRDVNPRLTARGYHKVVENLYDQSYDKSTSSATNHVTEHFVQTRFSNYRAGVLYHVALNRLGLAQLLGLDQPLEAVWELTRLSFVIDWLLNIGDLIASWTPNAALTPLGSWCTEEHKWVTTYQHSDMHYTGTFTATKLSESYGNKVIVYRLKRRIVDPYRPVLPHVRLNLDVAKVVDLVAIARSIYRSF